MKFLVLMVGVLLSASFSRPGSASIGTRGGGGANSDRIHKILEFLGPDGANLKTILITRVRQIQAITPVSPEASQILEMARYGLIEDIQKSKYVLSETCFDSKRAERAASTVQVNLRVEKKRVHPDICINVPLLAAQDNTEAQIEGLLVHEHARHFGYEDTDKWGAHPLAFAITRWHRALRHYADVITPDLNIGLSTTLGRYDFMAIGTTHPERITISVEELTGTCTHVRATYFKKDYPMTELREDLSKMTIRLQDQDNQELLLSGFVGIGSLALQAARPDPECFAKVVVRYSGETRFEKIFNLEAKPMIIINRARFCQPQALIDYCY